MRVPEVAELESGPPHEVAVENAYRKASAVLTGDGLVLGVDTVVALGQQIYGKPSDAIDARATLSALSGRRHAVVGGLCLVDAEGRSRTAAAFRYAFSTATSWAGPDSSSSTSGTRT